MVTSVSSPADLANNSLTRMGFKLAVGSLLDGSDHANVLLQLYGQTRDDMLRNFDYEFAKRDVVLTLLKTGPVGGYFPPNQWNPATMPPVGFLYEYAFPEDAVKVRLVKPQPLFLVNADPRPNDWTEYNDNSFTPAQRTIVTNVPDAIGVCTARVTDPSTWDVAFTEQLAAALARRAGPALVGIEAAKALVPDEMAQDIASEREGR